MRNLKTVVRYKSDSEDVVYYSWSILVFTDRGVVCDIRTIESDIHKAIDEVLEHCDFSELPPNYFLVIQDLERCTENILQN